MSYLAANDALAILQAPVGACGLHGADELSFAILSLVSQFIDRGYTASEAVGAIEDAKQELYRITIGPAMAQRKFEFGG